MANKFERGQLVYYQPERLHRTAASAVRYVVMQIFPDEGDGHQYRIRSEAEGFDRMAKEHELKPVEAA